MLMAPLGVRCKASLSLRIKPPDIYCGIGRLVQVYLRESILLHFNPAIGIDYLRHTVIIGIHHLHTHVAEGVGAFAWRTLVGNR